MPQCHGEGHLLGDEAECDWCRRAYEGREWPFESIPRDHVAGCLALAAVGFAVQRIADHSIAISAANESWEMVAGSPSSPAVNQAVVRIATILRDRLLSGTRG